MAQSRLGKDAILVPIGTTAQRPANPEAGMIRFNTDQGFVEWYDDGTDDWREVGTAESTSYNNTDSGLDADNVQDAIDEVTGDLGTMSTQDANNVNITGGNIEASTIEANSVITTGESQIKTPYFFGIRRSDSPLENFTSYAVASQYERDVISSGGYDESNSRFTAQEPGIYYVSFGFSEEDFYGNWGNIFIRITKNGSRVSEMRWYEHSSLELAGTVSALVSLNVGDYVEPQLRATSSDTSLSLESGTGFFLGYKVTSQ